MRWAFYSLVIPLIFNLACERNPSRQPAKVTFNFSDAAQNGVRTQDLDEAGFGCFVVLVHFNSDTDGSHCETFDDSFNSIELPVTGAFGPFQQNETAHLTLDTGPATFYIVGITNDSPDFCQDSGPAAFADSSVFKSKLASQETTLVSGDNNLTFTVDESESFFSLFGCQDVENVDNVSSASLEVAR